MNEPTSEISFRGGAHQTSCPPAAKDTLSIKRTPFETLFALRAQADRMSALCIFQLEGRHALRQTKQAMDFSSPLLSHQRRSRRESG